MVQTPEYKQKVREAVLHGRANYSGTDASYAISLGINNSVFSRLKKGETERLLADGQWLNLGRILGVSLTENHWRIAKTSVYVELEKALAFCQKNTTSMILVDDCGIGKSFCTKHILREMKNAFYVDCSQAKTKQQFVRLLAKTVGVDHQGRYADVIANLKYFLKLLQKPIIVLDEAGDLEYNAFLVLKELQNATEDHCAWFVMGADGLRAKIKRGVSNQKVGYREILSRLSDEFVSLVPSGSAERKAFYSQLIGDVAHVNVTNKDIVKRMVAKCMDKEATLRYLKTLINASAE